MDCLIDYMMLRCSELECGISNKCKGGGGGGELGQIFRPPKSSSLLSWVGN